MLMPAHVALAQLGCWEALGNKSVSASTCRTSQLRALDGMLAPLEST